MKEHRFQHKHWLQHLTATRSLPHHHKLQHTSMQCLLSEEVEHHTQHTTRNHFFFLHFKRAHNAAVVVDSGSKMQQYLYNLCISTH